MQITRVEARPSALAELRALWAVARREWILFKRYPSWLLSLIIWPVIFPAAYILSARALAGPDGSGVALFARLAGTDNYMGYIVIGTAVWMWQNMTLWSLGFALRMEQWRGTLETNWLSPARRFWLLLGNTRSYGGIADITYDALVDDARLDAYLFEGRGIAWEALTFLKLATRRHHLARGVHFHRLSELRIDTPGLAVQADGEYLGRSPISFGVDPHALYVLLPKGHGYRLFAAMSP